MKVAFVTNKLLHVHKTNVGDSFIGYGLKYILKQAIPEIEFTDVCRFTPFNSHDMQILHNSDCIIYAGMPQYNNLDDWAFYYDVEIWEDFRRAGRPVLRLAGGGGYPSDTMTPSEFSAHLSKSQKTKDTLAFAMKITKLLTTRDPMAHQFVIDQGYPSTLLPCSGASACRWFGVHETTKKYNAICLTSSYIKNNPEQMKIVVELKRMQKFLEDYYNKPCKIICQIKNSDYEFLKTHYSDEEIIVNDTLEGTIKTYSEVDVVVASRIHCALPIFGIGGRPIIIRVDTRGSVGDVLNIPVIPLSEFDAARVIHIARNDLFSKVNPLDAVEAEIAFYRREIPKALA